MSRPARWQDFLAPRYWGTWLMIGLLRVLALLSFRAGLVVGSGLGMLVYHLAVKRRRVAEVNIGLCFPELSEAEQAALVRESFKANGIGLVETAWAYWGDRQKIESITEFGGLDLLEDALARGRGVIMCGGHFSGLDLGGLLFSFCDKPFDCVYRPHNNPLMEYWICRKRARFTKLVDRKKVREILRDMRNNYCIWYAPDQDLGRNGSVFVPFFGQPAATITAASKLVKLNDSPILALSFRRKPDNSGYLLEFNPMPGFPSGDETTDARLMNEALERDVRKAPEQYMWMHKRFKTQPDGNQKLYKAAGC